MKQREFLREIREMHPDALQVKAKELSEESMKLCFRKTSGQLTESHRLGMARRDLARVLGEIKKREAASEAA